MSGTQNDKYAAPSGPPPGYGAQVQSPHSTGGPYSPNHDPNAAVVPYDQQQPTYNVRAPDPAYRGYSSPPPGGYYGQPDPHNNVYGQPGYGPPPAGFYGAPQQQMYGPPPQHMYYAAPNGYYPPPGGYYQDSRGAGAGGGICAGILAALACCCCLDIML